MKDFIKEGPLKEFIRGCAALFVMLGMISFVLAALFMVATIGQGLDIGIIGGVSMALGAAGVTLVGGTTYMLCLIHDRLMLTPQD